MLVILAAIVYFIQLGIIIGTLWDVNRRQIALTLQIGALDRRLEVLDVHLASIDKNTGDVAKFFREREVKIEE